MHDFLELHLDSISVTNAGFIVFLKTEGHSRVLPIFIGSNEAQAIALALSEDRPPRPLTHDLLKGMLDALDATVTRIEITELKEGTFYAKVHVLQGEFEEHEFDARPSDAIALAVRFEAPIFAAAHVFEEAAINVVLKNADENAEDSLDEAEDAFSADGDDENGEPDASVEIVSDGALEDPARGPAEEHPRTKPSAPPPPLSPLEKLKADLQSAVRDERYEEAARLRDVLKRMGAN